MGGLCMFYIFAVSAVFLKVNASVCGDNFTSASGSFATPNFPLSYPRNSRCEWYIQTEPRLVITLEFKTFRLENPSIFTGNCDYDVLHVTDGRDTLIGSFCGANNPGPIVSSTNGMTLLFLSDDSISHQGFSVHYSSGTPPTSPASTTPRTGSIISDNSWITSPGYPGNYANLLDEEYVISLKTGGRILLEFVDIDIESGSSCQYDYLEVRDGATSSSKMLARVCGKTASRVLGSSDTLHLHFVTDESVNKRGFNASWSKAHCEHFGGRCQKDECFSNEMDIECKAGSGLFCCTPNVLPKSCGERPLAHNCETSIVGGRKAGPNSWPWQVSLQDKDGYHFCGGSVITEEWILTAAHCVQGIDTVYIALGKHDLEKSSGNELHIETSDIFIHEDYKSGSPYPNDIALLRLEDPIQFSKAIQPVCLPDGGPFISEKERPKETCYMTGWGDTKGGGDKNTLNEVDVQIRSQMDCEAALGRNSILPSQLCTDNGKKGPCKGDFGGPLVCLHSGRWVLEGVSSWGKISCQEEGFPAVSTRVSAYRAWIVDKLLTESNKKDKTSQQNHPKTVS